MHYLLRPITPTNQLSWSPYGKTYKAILGVRISSLLSALFLVSPTISSFLPLVPLLFYPITFLSIAATTTPIVVPIVAPITILNGFFTEVLIAILLLSIAFTTILVVSAVLAVPAYQLATISTSNNSRSSIRGKIYRRITCCSIRQRIYYDRTYMPQSHGI